jgi:hypothetical protein
MERRAGDTPIQDAVLLIEEEVALVDDALKSVDTSPTSPSSDRWLSWTFRISGGQTQSLQDSI